MYPSQVLKPLASYRSGSVHPALVSPYQEVPTMTREYLVGNSVKYVENLYNNV